MTPERIEQILTDFRSWLQQLPTEPDLPTPPSEPISIHTLAAQFTALRHDVNMQTKAARAAVEQTNLLIQQQSAGNTVSTDEPEEFDLKPIVKMVLDLHDALRIAHRQLEKSIRLPEPKPAPAISSSPGFLARLFGVKPTELPADYVKDLETALSKQRELIAGAASGYAMSLRRIERIFPDLGLVPMNCDDQPFDPETMEVVDTESSEQHPPGTVIEVVRNGYYWNESLFRYAQVKVSRP